MSLPLVARQPVLRRQLRVANRVGLANTAKVSSVPAAQAIHTQPNYRGNPSSKRTWPIKTVSGGLLAAGTGWYLSQHAPTASSRSFTVHSPLESVTGSSSGKPVDGSSTLLRPDSPAAPHRQTVTLVFITSQSTGKGLVKSVMSNFGNGGSGESEKWFPWIGYFREAGYDCLQMNLALSSSSKGIQDIEKVTDKLADELHSQIRLSNLQRQPVLFVHHSADASAQSTSQIVSKYIDPSSSASSRGGGGILSSIFGGGMFSARPAISGLVVISDVGEAEALEVFAKYPKLNTLIVANGGVEAEGKKGKVTIMDANERGQEKVVKDIERWLIKEGYEG